MIRPVCIAGMHRSGTSMVTRLMNLCGLALGDAGDLMPPHDTNPDGFWEKQRIVSLNDKILDHFGGAWDLPPAFPAGWVDDPGLQDLKAEAGVIAAGFGTATPWGWKDPRNSLTYPFWKALIPDLRLIICVRNPLETSRSLRARDNKSARLADHLWLTYNRSLLEHTRPGERIVTHYDSYFYDHRRELRRVLGFIDLPATDETLDEAAKAVFSSLKHQAATRAETEESVPAELIDLYDRLCGEAGPICAEALAASRPFPQSRERTIGPEVATFAGEGAAAHPAEIRIARTVLASLEAQERRNTPAGAATSEKVEALYQEMKLLFARQLDTIEGALRARDRREAALQAELQAGAEQRAALEAAARIGEERRAALEAELRIGEERRVALETALQTGKDTLSAIYGSAGWKTLTLLKRLLGRR